MADVYTSPSSWKLLKHVKITLPPICPNETDFWLGHFECFGYKNKVSGPKRLFAAIFQTGLGIAVSGIIISLLVVNLRINFSPSAPTQIDQQAFVSVCTVIATFLGAVFWREQSDLHQKWQYLADLFNRIVELHPPENDSVYNMREHLLIGLAHDTLTMGMWAHRSFRTSFKEALERSIIFEKKIII